MTNLTPEEKRTIVLSLVFLGVLILGTAAAVFILGDRWHIDYR